MEINIQKGWVLLMVTLCLDSAQQYLALGVIQDHELIGQVFKELPKQQSEYILAELAQLFSSLKLAPTEIQAVVVTKGPGSFTGVRIGLTVAKVLTTQLQVPLYTLSTLLLTAGLEPVKVVLDARGGRVYYGEFAGGVAVAEPMIKNVSDLTFSLAENWRGDLTVFQEPAKFDNYVPNFLALRDYWELEANPASVKPYYLKNDLEYQVKK